MSPIIPILAALPFLAATVFGQGALTPPGAPAPMMKTLDQLEARTPIGTPGQVTTTTITISAPGSYVLMGPVTVASGTAIQINASNVTLDLNGFTITSTNTATAGEGILINGNLTDVTIRNGHIHGQATYANETYSGGGFAYGVRVLAAANVRISDLSLRALPSYGIYTAGADPSIVSDCQAYIIGGDAIDAATVMNCAANTCGGRGIIATTVINCKATSTASAHAIHGAEVFNSQGSSISGAGIYASDRAIGSYGSSTSGCGIEAPVAIDCKGTSGSNTGVKAIYMASRCMGISSTATGLYSQIADSCRASNAGDATTIALSATTASNCHVNATLDGTGISASCIQNCYAIASGGGKAINSTGTIANCFAQSNTATAINGNIVRDCYATSNGGGAAINATTAMGCHAYSSGPGTTLYATKASDCHGVNASSGCGLYATDIAENCLGSSVSGNGLNCAGSATNCQGRSTSGTHGIYVQGTATNCRGYRPGGIALYAYIAIGCIASSGTISTSNPYNMPTP